MSLETEVKVALTAVDEFRRRLSGLDAAPLSPRHFEDNVLLDYADRRLRRQGCLLRVRTAGEVASATFKGPPAESAMFKIREELEIRVDNACTAVRIFEQLGLRVWFRYQKYRTEYRIGGDEEQSRVTLALDETPIGVYAELEGSQEAIRRAAASMGYDASRFLRDSYYGLYLEFCRARGMPPGDMVFDAQKPAGNP